jgi:hypothetical protein
MIPPNEYTSLIVLTLSEVSPLGRTQNTSGAAHLTAPPMEDVVRYEVPSKSGMIMDKPKSVN